MIAIQNSLQTSEGESWYLQLDSEESNRGKETGKPEDDISMEQEILLLSEENGDSIEGLKSKDKSETIKKSKREIEKESYSKSEVDSKIDHVLTAIDGKIIDNTTSPNINATSLQSSKSTKLNLINQNIMSEISKSKEKPKIIENIDFLNVLAGLKTFVTEELRNQQKFFIEKETKSNTNLKTLETTLLAKIEEVKQETSSMKERLTKIEQKDLEAEDPKRIEKERLEKERLEQERLEQERLEKERNELQRKEQLRLEDERKREEIKKKQEFEALEREKNKKIREIEEIYYQELKKRQNAGVTQTTAQVNPAAAQFCNQVKNTCFNNESNQSDKDLQQSSVNSSNVDVQSLIKAELNRLGLDQRATFKTVAQTTNIQRDYKLTSKIKFDFFYDYLTSELRTLDLLYVIEPNEKRDRHDQLDESVKADHKHKVRDIIITRIESNYHSRLLEVQDPVEVVAKLKFFKSMEHNLSSVDLRAQLYDMKPNYNKERAADFIEKFEEIVRNCNNTGSNISEKEKRDLMFRATRTVVANLSQVEHLSKYRLGHEMTYEEIKNCLLQDEADRQNLMSKRDVKERAVMAISKDIEQNRCYNCGMRGHKSYECRNNGPFCYKCRKIGHKAPECRTRDNDNDSRGLKSQRFQNFDLKRRERYVPYSKESKNKNKSKSNSGFRRGTKRENNDGQTYDNKRVKNNPSNTQPKPKNPNSQQPKNSGGKGEHIIANNCISNYIKSDCKERFFNKRDLDHDSKIVKFLADSGATEHLTNTKILFKSFDSENIGKINCANKNPSASLRTEGVGEMKILLNNGSHFELKDVI